MPKITGTIQELMENVQFYVNTLQRKMVGMNLKFSEMQMTIAVTEKGKKMWIETTQVYGFSNPDEWRKADDFAENLRKSGVPFSWNEDTNTIRIIIADYVRGQMSTERREE